MSESWFTLLEPELPVSNLKAVWVVQDEAGPLEVLGRYGAELEQ